MQKMEVWILITCLWSISITQTDGQCQQDSNNFYRFGPACKYMCHCKDGMACDQTTGECDNGCDPGWVNPSCQYRDIAVGEYSRISDNLSGNHQYAFKANDGDETTCSHTDLTTRNSNNPAWWRLWLPYNFTLTDIRIKTLPDKLQYFPGFTVYVDFVPEVHHTDNNYVPSYRKLCYQHDGSTINSQDNIIRIQCTETHQGNALRIYLPTNGQRAQLVLCDVNVIIGRNMAFDQAVTMSSHESQTEYLPPLSVDGSSRNSLWDYCAMTSTEKTPSWEIDLGVVANIVKINITYYNEITFSGYSLRVKSLTSETWTDVYNANGSSAKNINADLYLTTARYLSIYRPSQYGRLGVCEFEVFGDCAEDNRCGLNCQTPCYCSEPVTVANRLTGVCKSGCLPRWTGQNGMCDKICPEDKWGTRCEFNCGGCMHGTCDATNGYCSGSCKPGYHTSQRCDQECDNGTYGFACAFNCDTTLCDGGCDKVDGKCKSCVAGFTGAFCQTECPSGSWGANCKYQCSSGCLNNTCSPVDGMCVLGCKSGYTNSTHCDCLFARPPEENVSNDVARSVVFGAVSTVVAVISIAVCTLLLYKLRKQKALETQRPYINKEPTVTTEGNSSGSNAPAAGDSTKCYETLTVSDPENVYNDIDTATL